MKNSVEKKTGLVFWKDNKIDEERRMSESEVEARFRNWVQGYSIDYLSYYQSEMIVRHFITGKEGLSSTFKESQLYKIMAILKPILVNFIELNTGLHNTINNAKNEVN